MANNTNKLIADSLLLFASAKTQLEGGRALLEQARATLVKLGGCDREIMCLGDCERATVKALALLEHKIRYVSNIASADPKTHPIALGDEPQTSKFNARGRS